MNYLKRPISQESFDSIRITLSMRLDVNDPATDVLNTPLRLGPEPVCDWCGGPEPVVVYASNRMSTGEMTRCWRWTACERCERMVERENWDALQRKIASRMKTLFAPRMNRDFPSGLPDELINEGVAHALEEFHLYGIRILGDEAGGGKSQTNTFTGEQS